MVIDLRRQEARFVEDAFRRFVLVIAQLAPQAAADDGDERNDSGEHQPQQSRSDCAQQHRLAHLSRGLRRRGPGYRRTGFRRGFTEKITK